MSDQELIQALRCIPKFGKDGWMKSDMAGVAFAAADRIANQSTYILALQKEIERLRAQLPRWIPVTERLPEPTVCVLIADATTGNMDVDAWGHDGWMSEDLYDGSITHWMPLPEPPEVEQ